MPTASYLIADIQTKLGDPSGNIFTSARLLPWLDEAQKRFVLGAMPLRIIDATTVATGIYKFAMPSNVIMVEGLFSRNSIAIKMKRLHPDDWHTQFAACPGARGHDSDSWTEIEQTIYTHPAFGTAPASCLLGSSISATATTIPVNTTAGFKAWGRILLESEEIEYTSLDKTNFYGCTRGLGNSVAVSHSPSSGGPGPMIQQCDLWLVYRRWATALGTVTATPEIHSIWHEGLELYVMYLAYKQEGSQDKAEAMWSMWESFVEKAWFSGVREHLSPIGLSDFETTQMKSLYGPR